MMHASLLNRRLSSHRALQARHTSSQAKHGRPLLRRAGYMYSAIPTKWNERHLRVHVCRYGSNADRPEDLPLWSHALQESPY